MTEHKVSGELAGEHEMVLASYADGRRCKQLFAQLWIDSDNAWSTGFITVIDGKFKKHQSLAAAVREYDNA